MILVVHIFGHYLLLGDARFRSHNLKKSLFFGVQSKKNKKIKDPPKLTLYDFIVTILSWVAFVYAILPDDRAMLE